MILHATVYEGIMTAFGSRRYHIGWRKLLLLWIISIQILFRFVDGSLLLRGFSVSLTVIFLVTLWSILFLVMLTVMESIVGYLHCDFFSFSHFIF